MTIKSIYKYRNSKEIIERWNNKASSWDEVLEDEQHHLNLDNGYKYFIKYAQEKIEKRIKNRVSLLDLACGTGILSEYLAHYFEETTGIDISDKMIEEAKKKNIHNATFIQIDCFELDDLNKTFDVIVSRGIICSHYGKELMEELLVKLRGSLNNEGVVILDVLNKGGEDKYDYKVIDKAYYTPKEIKKIGKKCGFQNVEIFGEESRVLFVCFWSI